MSFQKGKRGIIFIRVEIPLRATSCITSAQDDVSRTRLTTLQTGKMWDILASALSTATQQDKYEMHSLLRCIHYNLVIIMDASIIKLVRNLPIKPLDRLGRNPPLSPALGQFARKASLISGHCNPCELCSGAKSHCWHGQQH